MLFKCRKCNECGHKAVDCPKSSIHCFRCNKPGHISKNCNAQLQNESDQEKMELESSDDD